MLRDLLQRFSLEWRRSLEPFSVYGVVEIMTGTRGDLDCIHTGMACRNLPVGRNMLHRILR